MFKTSTLQQKRLRNWSDISETRFEIKRENKVGKSGSLRMMILRVLKSLNLIYDYWSPIKMFLLNNAIFNLVTY